MESRGGVNPISTVGHAVHTVAIFVERDGVNVNLEARGVHQYEVTGRATVPESKPFVPKDLAQLSQIPDPHDEIDVLVWPSLHTEERINAPAPVEPCLEHRVDEELEQLNQGRGSHHSVLAPPNGSRLSCGDPPAGARSWDDSPCPPRAQHSASLKAITARQLQALVRRPGPESRSTT